MTIVGPTNSPSGGLGANRLEDEVGTNQMNNDDDQDEVEDKTPDAGDPGGTGYSAQDTFERSSGPSQNRPVMVAQLGGPGQSGGLWQNGQWTGAGPAPSAQRPAAPSPNPYGPGYSSTGQWQGAGPAPGSQTPPSGGLGPMYGPNGQWQGAGPSPQQVQSEQRAQFGQLSGQAYRATPPGYSMAQVQNGLNQLMQQGYSQSHLSFLAQNSPDRLSSLLQGVMGPRPGPTIGAPQQVPFGVRMLGPPNEDLGTGIFWQGINNFGPPGAAGAPSFPNPPTLVPRGGRGIPGR
jgi:hypothetical protein